MSEDDFSRGYNTGQRDAQEAHAEWKAAQPSVAHGWKLVPLEPTETMIVSGFESAPDRHFSPTDEWERYEAMTGCQQAAYRAEMCWKAMLQAAPATDATIKARSQP